MGEENCYHYNDFRATHKLFLMDCPKRGTSFYTLQKHSAVFRLRIRDLPRKSLYSKRTARNSTFILRFSSLLYIFCVHIKIHKVNYNRYMYCAISVGIHISM
jgi:hypothetical protein